MDTIGKTTIGAVFCDHTAWQWTQRNGTENDKDPRVRRMVPTLAELKARRVSGEGATRAGSMENRRLDQGLEAAFKWGKGGEGVSSNQISPI